MSPVSNESLDEAGIKAYRRALHTEAEIARGDLDEIEDHLRSLALELRANGLTGLEAVTEAARRIGEPALVAREHARVRSAFGARLTRLRSWGAAALLAPFGVYYAATAGGPGAIMWLLLIAALVSRLTWRARASPACCRSGVVASAVALMGAASNPAGDDRAMRGDVGGERAARPVEWLERADARGVVAVLLAPAYVSQVSSGSLQLTGPTALILSNVLPTVMLIGLIVAFAGTLLRARWAAIGGAAVADRVLLLAAIAVWPLFARFANATYGARSCSASPRSSSHDRRDGDDVAQRALGARHAARAAVMTAFATLPEGPCFVVIFSAASGRRVRRLFGDDGDDYATTAARMWKRSPRPSPASGRRERGAARTDSASRCRTGRAKPRSRSGGNIPSTAPHARAATARGTRATSASRGVERAYAGPHRDR